MLRHFCCYLGRRINPHRFGGREPRHFNSECPSESVLHFISALHPLSFPSSLTLSLISLFFFYFVFLFGPSWIPPFFGQAWLRRVTLCAFGSASPWLFFTVDQVKRSGGNGAVGMAGGIVSDSKMRASDAGMYFRALLGPFCLLGVNIHSLQPVYQLGQPSGAQKSEVQPK